MNWLLAEGVIDTDPLAGIVVDKPEPPPVPILTDEDHRPARGMAMARNADPTTYATIVTHVYSPGVPNGVARLDDRAMHEIESAVQIAERSGDDLALGLARMTLGLALVHRDTDVERDRGHKLLADVREAFLHRQYALGDLPVVEVYLAREDVRHGERDNAIPRMRAAADHLAREGQMLGWGMPATAVLVETLLDRVADGDSEGDLAEAEAAIERLAAAHADGGSALRDVWVLRLRALLWRARGDAAQYAHFRDRYREMAATVEFYGQIAWADVMP